MATTNTTRKCPWCGTRVLLAHSPVVATNLSEVDREVGTGVSGLGGGEFAFDEEFTLESSQDFDTAPKNGEVPAPAPEERARPVSGADVLGYAGDLPVVAAPFLDPQRPISRYRRWMAKPLPPVLGSADARDLPARACTSCHRPLPADIDERDVLLISVLGINRAGKTYLLATALDQAMRHDALKTAGITDFVADEHTANRFHRDYYLPVFRRRSRLDPTQDPAMGDSVEPMIFRFEIGGTPYLLALHDLAGEAVADPHRRAVIAPFVRHSDALLFVVDPLEIEAVRNKLPFEQVTVDWRGWSQLDVLRGCIDTLGKAAPHTPVGVVLTKSDLIGLAEKKRFTFDRPPRQDNWAAEQADVDREVRALLHEWDVGSFEEATAATGPASFHAVSAFGAPPEDASMPGVVDPLRVVDPFGMLIQRISEARSTH